MKSHGPYRSLEHGCQLDQNLAAGDIDGVRHCARYWWAWALAAKVGARRIIDLGCGAGYGAKILAQHDSRLQTPPAIVAGVDADSEALQLARITDDLYEYPGAPPTYNQVDLNAPWYDEPRLARFFPADVLVCFECFEILKHREEFLRCCVTAMDPRGMLLLSAYTNYGACIPYPRDSCYHYTEAAIGNLLRRYFRNVYFRPPPGVVNFPHAFDPVYKMQDMINTAAAKLEKLRGLLACENVIYCSDPIKEP